MKDLQNKVKKFCEDNDLNSDPGIRILDLVSEVGEFSKEILKSSDYGKKEVSYRSEMKSELGDIIFVLLMLANHFNIDIEEALDAALSKYKNRAKRGAISSEND